MFNLSPFSWKITLFPRFRAHFTLLNVFLCKVKYFLGINNVPRQCTRWVWTFAFIKLRLPLLSFHDLRQTRTSDSTTMEAFPEGLPSRFRNSVRYSEIRNIIWTFTKPGKTTEENLTLVVEKALYEFWDTW